LCPRRGGVGKSTLARALAAVAAVADIGVKLVDLDVRQRTTSSWQERRETNRAGRPLQVATFASLAEALDASTDSDELLIVDAPAGTSRGTLKLAQRADLLVQPTGPGIDDLDPAIMLFHELARTGVPRPRLVMALCRIATADEERKARTYIEEAGYGVLPGCIPERAAYRDAHNHGRAVTETRLKVLNARTDTLVEALLTLIAEKVRARVKAAAPSIKAPGRSA
jgi:chromosome partitioning protein